MRKHYDLAVKMGLSDSLIIGHHDKKTGYMRHLRRILSGQEVLIVGSYDKWRSSASFCAFMRSPLLYKRFKRTFTWASKETDENAWTTNMIMRWDADLGIRRILAQRFKRLIEMQVLRFMGRSAVTQMAAMFGNSGQVYACMSNIIQYPDVVMDSLAIKHYRGLFILLLMTSSSFPTICLVCELMRKKLLRNV